jgi:hypothetical protein
VFSTKNCNRNGYDCKKNWNICFPKELFPKEGALLARELRPFFKENSLLLEEVIFFSKEFFLLHRVLACD